MNLKGIIDADRRQMEMEDRLGRVFHPQGKKKKPSRPFLFTKVFNEASFKLFELAVFNCKPSCGWMTSVHN